jgi:integrase/recombinase XerD
MTFDEAYNLFHAYGVTERLYAKETVSKMRECFRTWIAPALADRELTALNLAPVQELRARMVAKGLSISRQYGVLMWIKTFLKFCRASLHVATLDPAEIRLPRRPAPNVQYLTPDEVHAVRSAIPVHTYPGKRLRALVELLLGTGLRIGEALSLDREVFDKRMSETSIVGKGGRRRTIFFTDEAAAWVHLYLRNRSDNHPALFVTIGDRPGRLGRSDISRLFLRLRADAGIKKPLTPHLLRHTYCTNLLNNGVDIRFIRDLAGHRDIQTTARFYLGVDEKKLREIVAARVRYTANEQAAGAPDQSPPVI